jgi:hypothetical protein
LSFGFAFSEAGWEGGEREIGECELFEEGKALEDERELVEEEEEEEEEEVVERTASVRSSSFCWKMVTVSVSRRSLGKLKSESVSSRRCLYVEFVDM